MAEGRLRAQWEQTAALGAWIINSNPFRSGKPISPADLNPYRRRQPAAEIRLDPEQSMDALAMAFGV